VYVFDTCTIMNKCEGPYDITIEIVGGPVVIPPNQLREVTGESKYYSVSLPDYSCSQAWPLPMVCKDMLCTTLNCSLTSQTNCHIDLYCPV